MGYYSDEDLERMDAYETAREKSSGGGGGDGGGCFPADTKITTPHGDIKISELCEGDMVTSCNADVSSSGKKILKVKKYKNNPLCKIIFTDNSELTTTPTHSFNRHDSWVKASKLSQGDELLCFELGVVTTKEIKSVRMLAKKEAVYNLIVEDNYNFIASGVLAHSFTYFRKTRVLLGNFRKLEFSKKRIFLPA